MGILDVLRSLLNIFRGKDKKDSQPEHQQQQHRPQQSGQFPGQHTQPHQQPHQQQHSYPPKNEQQQHPGGQSPGGRPPPRQDLNQQNQADTHYTGLRARANQAGDAMGRAFDGSHTAYSSGDGARAKDLSNQGKAHQREMEKLNKEASDWIYIKNNEDSGPGEIDLHGLYVKEAITRTDEAIEQAKRRGDSTIHLIVGMYLALVPPAPTNACITGKGIHSSGGAAKIKPAITELMQKHQLVAEVDPENAGVLVVHLGGGGGRNRGMGSDEITNRLGKNDDCTIM